MSETKARRLNISWVKTILEEENKDFKSMTQIGSRFIAAIAESTRFRSNGRARGVPVSRSRDFEIMPKRVGNERIKVKWYFEKRKFEPAGRKSVPPHSLRLFQTEAEKSVARETRKQARRNPIQGKETTIA